MKFINFFLFFLKKKEKIIIKSLLIPCLILVLLTMLIVPLSPFLLDILFTFNITLSIMILISTMLMQHTLEFSSFPIILLFSTLLRLSLNIASTRIILLKGHLGSVSAGYVIESFGNFLVGGNFIIGIVIFIILVIINFIVITKGVSRISEVGARFTLDAMPGKQMAIDSDLNSGLIQSTEAKKRRLKIEKEADFYGSMDGASKFVRGDAIAGIIIMFVNLLGGLFVGIWQHNMTFSEASQIYCLLTIGDGLVAQIPSLIISTASAIIVTRINSDQNNVGDQILQQLFNVPKVILLSGLVIGILGLIPGMPHLVFLLFTFGLCILSWRIYKKELNLKNFDKKKKDMFTQNEHNITLSWKDVSFEELMVIELSHDLISLTQTSDADGLLLHLNKIRKNFAQEIGFLPSIIHVLINHELLLNQYRILVKGIEIARGKVYLNKLLAIDNGSAKGVLTGKKIYDPVFNLPAFWIKKELEQKAISKNFLIVKNSMVIITHFHNIIKNYFHEIFGFQETQELLDYISQSTPKLVESLIPSKLSVFDLQKILQNLLKEKISIRDIRTILETLLEFTPTIKKDLEILTGMVRIALRKSITQKYFFNSGDIKVLGLNFELETLLLNNIEKNNYILDPKLAENLIKNTKIAIEIQKKNKNPIILLVNHSLRFFLARIFFKSIPELIVLSFFEISEERNVIITVFIR
ncbi:flagellar biosynthesis protein FlhA [Buchnera aphidicola]|uniref:flagellar biosynthesis protein FlhA n=1 Tax=Buchnera aphidicola TaxID=9 RepID=UPI00313D3CCE